MNENIKRLIMQVAFVLSLVIVMAFIKGNMPEKDESEQAKKEDIVAQEEGVQVEVVAVEEEETQVEGDEPVIEEDGSYTDKTSVALYIHTYNHLPDNYVTKEEADKLGWDSAAGNLQEVAPGKSIGGSHFGNYDEALPEAEGRKYQECDIDYEGGQRNAKRIVFSNDGLIFYTDDHYKTFEQLY